jgi:hypothetical protein
MSADRITLNNRAGKQALVVGTCLAVASLILIPAFATRIGIGSSLTGALRIALMKASYRAASKDKKADGTGAAAPPSCCH